LPADQRSPPAAIAGAAGIAGGGKVRIIVNLGTTGAQTASALAAEAQRHSVTLLDAAGERR
jgi:3-hydroxyisobutyrate dehydrogenase-like beta-hydroxyacid dehydrogenase